MLTDRPPIRKTIPMFESGEPDDLFTVETPGERLDRLLAETLPDLSRTRLQARWQALRGRDG